MLQQASVWLKKLRSSFPTRNYTVSCSHFTNETPSLDIIVYDFPCIFVFVIYRPLHLISVDVMCLSRAL